MASPSLHSLGRAPRKTRRTTRRLPNHSSPAQGRFPHAALGRHRRSPVVAHVAVPDSLALVRPVVARVAAHHKLATQLADPLATVRYPAATLTSPGHASQAMTNSPHYYRKTL
jgi:hypothetical protein